MVKQAVMMRSARLYQLASATHFTAQSGQGRAYFGLNLLPLFTHEPASQPRFPARSTHSTIVYTPERESVFPQCFRTHLLTRLSFWVHSCSDAFWTDKCVSDRLTDRLDDRWEEEDFSGRILTCTLGRRVLEAFHLAQASFAVSRTRLLACHLQVAKGEHVV